jgi:hypothetical protein
MSTPSPNHITNRLRRQQLPLLSASIRHRLTTLRCISETTHTPRPTPNNDDRRHQPSTHSTTGHQPPDYPTEHCEFCGCLGHDQTECPYHDVVYDKPDGPPRPRADDEPKPGRNDILAIPRAVAAQLLTDATTLHNLYATKNLATVVYSNNLQNNTAYAQAVAAAVEQLSKMPVTGEQTRAIQNSALATLQMFYSGIFTATFPEFANDVATALELDPRNMN